MLEEELSKQQRRHMEQDWIKMMEENRKDKEPIQEMA